MSEAKEEILKRKREVEEEQRDFQREQRKLQEAFNQHGELSREWLREILNTDDLERYLNEYELQKVRALINKQWILSNLTEAQEHDRWYKLEVMKYKIYGSFPPKESSIQGPIRAFLMDDRSEMLTALSAEQRNAIDQIILSLQNMVTRSKEGFERKQINTRYAGTEQFQDSDEDTESSGLSLFS